LRKIKHHPILPAELKKKGMYFAMEKKLEEAIPVFEEMVKVSVAVNGGEAEHFYFHAKAIFESGAGDKEAAKKSAKKCVQLGKAKRQPQPVKHCQALLDKYAK
jgi:hypothetical protein